MDPSVLLCPICREPVLLTACLLLESPLTGFERKQLRLHRACGGRLLVALSRAFAQLPNPSYPELIDHFMERPDTLSTRETEVLILLSHGLQDKEIAADLHLSPKTIKNYLALVYQKLGASNRTHAAIIGISMGLIPVPTDPTA